VQRAFIAFVLLTFALVIGLAVYLSRVQVDVIEPVVEVEAPAAPEIVRYPSFTMNDMDGNPRDFSEWDGRHRLLNFWATWCAPCRREIPLLKEFQAEQGDDGILIMGVAVDYPEEVAVFAEAAEFNYPILVGQEEAMTVAESSGIQFIAMPFTMIVSRNGELLGAYLGELHRSHLDTISGLLGRLDSGEMGTEQVKEGLAEL
jgi:thiol-disulfide isomerase/thioredoxin